MAKPREIPIFRHYLSLEIQWRKPRPDAFARKPGFQWQIAIQETWRFIGFSDLPLDFFNGRSMAETAPTTPICRHWRRLRKRMTERAFGRPSANGPFQWRTH